MNWRPNSLTPEILRLAEESDKTQAEIAKTLGCSRANVAKALARNGRSTRRTANTVISALPVDHRRWLIREAKRTNVRWRDLARALLVDAIEEAQNAGG